MFPASVHAQFLLIKSYIHSLLLVQGQPTMKPALAVAHNRFRLRLYGLHVCFIFLLLCIRPNSKVPSVIAATLETFTGSRQMQDGSSEDLIGDAELHDMLYQHHYQSLRSHHDSNDGLQPDQSTHSHKAHPHHHHKKAWMVLEEVNGLRNEDVVMVVSSTTIKGYLQSRIIPSARTWMRFFANVFVIVEGKNEYLFFF